MDNSSIFISYAREDCHLVKQITAALATREISAWVDTEALDYASLWQEEISQAILRAQLMVVVVTPAFLNSLACRFEVERAERLKKRLLPIITTGISEQQIPPALSGYQWFKVQSEQPDVEQIAQWISKSLSLNPDWLRRHTDFTVRAQRWIDQQRDTSLLLRGKDLTSAQALLQQSSDKDKPIGSDLVELIAVSERVQSRRRMTLAGVLGGSALAVVVAATFGWVQQVQADEQAKSGLRHQLGQLAIAGDVAGLLQVAANNNQRLQQDPMANMQVNLYRSDSLVADREQTLSGISALEIKGDWALLHEQFTSGSVFNVKQWNEPTRLPSLREGENQAASLSETGTYHASWSGPTIQIGKNAEHGTDPQRFEYPHQVQHISLLENTQRLVIQSSLGISVHDWSPTSKTIGPARMALDGAELLRAFSNGDVLYRTRNSPNSTAGDGYEVWIHRAGQAHRLGQFKGNIRQVYRNQSDVIALRIKREVIGFQLNAEATGEPIAKLGKVWVADLSGVSLSNRDARLAVVDPTGEARILAFSNEDVEINQGKSLRQNPSAVSEEITEDLDAIRSGADGIAELKPVFDLDDSRVFSPGEFNRILAPINAQTIASMDSNVGTDSGLADNLFALSGDGEQLIGLTLNHGGNGTVTVRRFNLPDRLQLAQFEALAVAPIDAAGGFYWINEKGVVSFRKWNDKGHTGKTAQTERIEQLSIGREGVPLANRLLAAAFSTDGQKLWAITADNRLVAWLNKANQFQPQFEVNLPMDWRDRLNRYRPLSASADGSRLLITGRTGAALIDSSTGKDVCDIPHHESFYDGLVTFLDRDTVISTNMDFTNGTGWENRQLLTYSARDCKPVQRFNMPKANQEEQTEQGYGFGIQLERTGQPWIVDRRFGAKYRIRDLSTNQTIGALSNHQGRVLTLLQPPASGLLFSSDETGSINVWEAQSQRRIKTLYAPHCEAIDLKWSEISQQLLAQCAEGEVVWWNLAGRP